VFALFPGIPHAGSSVGRATLISITNEAATAFFPGLRPLSHNEVHPPIDSSIYRGRARRAACFAVLRRPPISPIFARHYDIPLAPAIIVSFCRSPPSQLPLTCAGLGRTVHVNTSTPCGRPREPSNQAVAVTSRRAKYGYRGYFSAMAGAVSILTGPQKCQHFVSFGRGLRTGPFRASSGRRSDRSGLRSR
jgi:hypothetical protein